MSNEITSIAKKRVVGSSSRKAVLMYMADNASDDGTGIWTSKGNMARDLEMGVRTVQVAISDLIEMGVIRQVGTRKCVNGFTIEYAIILAVLEGLRSTRETPAADAPPREPHPTPAGAAPHPRGSCTGTPAGAADEPPFNHPGTSQEPPDLFSGKDPEREENEISEEAPSPPASDPPPEVPADPPPADRAMEFWDAYPKCDRKTDRPKVLALFRQIVAGKHKTIAKTDPEIIISAVVLYRDSKPDPTYVPMPLTWLNGARWEQWQGEARPDPRPAIMKLIGFYFAAKARERPGDLPSNDAAHLGEAIRAAIARENIPPAEVEAMKAEVRRQMGMGSAA